MAKRSMAEQLDELQDLIGRGVVKLGDFWSVTFTEYGINFLGDFTAEKMLYYQKRFTASEVQHDGWRNYDGGGIVIALSTKEVHND